MYNQGSLEENYMRHRFWTISHLASNFAYIDDILYQRFPTFYCERSLANSYTFCGFPSIQNDPNLEILSYIPLSLIGYLITRDTLQLDVQFDTPSLTLDWVWNFKQFSHRNECRICIV